MGNAYVYILKSSNMPINPVFDLKGWFKEHENSLKPPVGNKLIYEDDDWIVMAVGGPNSRKDYHYHFRGPEFFYMVRGDMVLKMKREDEEGNLYDDDAIIREGEIFLLPRETIHSPQRPAGSWGLVLEAKARNGEVDQLHYYCENCNNLLYKEEFLLSNIVTELPPIMEKYFDSEDLRTCNECGKYMEEPEPFSMETYEEET